MRTRYFIAGILLLALFAGCSSDSGEGDAPGGGSGDLYGYVRDASGSAIEGVVVSDGYTCTVTGADGRYAMAAASERLLRLLFDAGRLQGRGRLVDGTAAVLPEDQEIAAAVRFHSYPSGRGDKIPHAGHRRPAGDHHGAGLPFRDGDRRRHQLLRGGPDGRTAHLCDHAGRHRGQQMGTLSRYGQGDGAEQDVGSRLPDDRQPRPRVSAGDRPLGAA